MKKYKYFTENEQLVAVENNPFKIKYCKNPSSLVMRNAIKKIQTQFYL